MFRCLFADREGLANCERSDLRVMPAGNPSCIPTLVRPYSGTRVLDNERIEGVP